MSCIDLNAINDGVTIGEDEQTAGTGGTSSSLAESNDSSISAQGSSPGLLLDIGANIGWYKSSELCATQRLLICTNPPFRGQHKLCTWFFSNAPARLVRDDKSCTQYQ